MFLLKINRLLLLLLFLIAGYTGCADLKSNENLVIYPESTKFGDYWYQGKAELNRFELQQVRYGEIHKGDAVLIFVTEDFLNEEQVKFEYGSDNSNVQSILKLNFNRRFYTGIYPYTLMTSTFFPIRSFTNHAIKISSSALEWCGHSYMQLNNRQDIFRIQLHSYFQNEGDQQFDIQPQTMEDELWTLIRVNPDLLPLGKIKIIPGMQYVRLLHTEFEAVEAMAEKKEISDSALSKNSLILYSLQYQDLSRRLEISYEKDFPHQILAWEETYKPLNVNTSSDALMVTTAKRTNKVMLDYWNKNSVADSTYRYNFENSLIQ